MGRWMHLALAFGMLGACGQPMEEEPLVSEQALAKAERSLNKVSTLAPDPYANAVVPSGVTAVINPGNAVGAPDGNVASFLSLLGGSLLLDMGAGEEGTGPLRIYYQGVSISVVAQVDFLAADMSLISTGQATLLDLGIGTHSAEVPFSSATPYRYVRLRGGLAALYSVDAVEDTGFSGGALCGNGQVDPGEACDDGNVQAGDGCSATCEVEPGYSCTGTQPSVCTDNNECTNGTAQCSVNADCTNTPGSYTCTCRPGYSGDGVTCEDIDECSNGTAQCSVNADCTNTPGSYTCACRPGYSGDGVTCEDIDECSNGTATCQPGELCVNTPGSYDCVSGACQPPEVQCGTQCVDLSSNPSNCGACGNVCDTGEMCSQGACVESVIQMQIATSWALPGDGDLVVRTPTGKLIHKGNRGPSTETDFGSMDMTATSGWGPERVIWSGSALPPAGLYDICFKAANYTPEPSFANPISYTVTVMRLGQPYLILWGAVFDIDTSIDCYPGHPSYVTTVSYPAGP